MKMTSWQSYSNFLDELLKQGFIASVDLPTSPGVYQIRIASNAFARGEGRYGPHPVIHIGSAKDLQSRIESFFAGALGLHVYHSSAVRMIHVRTALSIQARDLEFCFLLTSNETKLKEERRLKREFAKRLSKSDRANLRLVRACIKNQLPKGNRYPVDKSLPIVVAR